MKNPKDIIWAFFGTSEFSVIVLDQLKARGFIPTLVVTVEDKPKGRKLVLTPPPTKVWAEKEGIKYVQLKILRKEESVEIIKSYAKSGFDLFIVASYGKIIPQNILDIPKYHCLNVHPSLLPKLRGPSPLESAILKENETGVTIIKVGAEMDQGPILTQEKIDIEWPPYFEDLEKTSAKVGGRLLAELIPDWIDGKIKEVEQVHNQTTVCVKIEKRDGEINLNGDLEINLRKIRAFHQWPTAYFFNKSKRVIVKRAHIKENKLILDRVLPEGRKEMSYEDYLRGHAK